MVVMTIQASINYKEIEDIGCKKKKTYAHLLFFSGFPPDFQLFSTLQKYFIIFLLTEIVVYFLASINN